MNKNTIQKILNRTGPLSSIHLIERFFALLQEEDIHTLSKKESDRICMFVTNDCKDIFYEKLTLFLNHSRMSKKNEENSMISSVHSYSDFNQHITLYPMKKKSKKRIQNRGSAINPNSSDYNSQLLKANLKSKFEGYEYGLSDW